MTFILYDIGLTSKLYSTIVKHGTIAIKDGGIEVTCVYRGGSVCVRRLDFDGKRSAPRKRRRSG